MWTRWSQRRSALREEIQTHIELEIEENVEAGMSPEEARLAAHRKFGNAPLAMDRSREVWGAQWLEYLLQDLRYTLRNLKKSPGYIASVVLTLTLGLGSVATMLAVVDSVLLRPVAVPHPHQLVMLYGETGHASERGELTYSQIEDLQRNGHLFTAVAGYAPRVKPVETSTGTRWALVDQVTPGFFSMIGVPAASGRLPDSNNLAPVAVVSDDFWKQRLDSDPHAIGSAIHIDGELRTIIGILPRGINLVSRTGGPVVYLPVSMHVKQSGPLTYDAAMVMARMKPGVTMPQALAEARSILNATKVEDGVKGRQLAIESYASFLTGSMQKPLFVMLGGVLILLVIACANAANLQIARAMERMTEMHVRSALGASFGRLLQQLLAESAVISLLGAVLGCALALASTAIIRAGFAQRYPRFREVAMHPIVFAAIALLALLAGILASLAPAFSIRRRTRAAVFTQAATPRTRVSGLLVILQIALTCVLLGTVGLFLRTFRALQQVQLGFNPHHVTTLVLMPVDANAPPELLRQTDTRLLDRFQALPGVQSAAMQTALPFSSYSFTMWGTTDVSGRPFHKGDVASYSFVSSNFVSASGIPLLRGRGFTGQDDTSPNMVALVNQAFVRKFLFGRNPIGVTLKMHRDPGETTPDPLELQGSLVVGVVQNELQGQDLGAAFEPMVYLDYRQIPASSEFLGMLGMMSQFAIRSPLPQGVLDSELRDTLKQVAPDMAEMQLQPMEQGIAQSLGQRTLALRLVSGFAAVALLLAAIGIYGMLSYAVTLRRREIGIRMALGSSRSGATQLVLRQAGRMVVAGVLPGLAGAWAAGHAVRSFLFGVQPLDPAALLEAVAVLLLAGVVAAALPAWRAARTEPSEVLRQE